MQFSFPRSTLCLMCVWLHPRWDQWEKKWNSTDSVGSREWKRWGPLHSFHTVNPKYLRLKPQLTGWRIASRETAWERRCFVHSDVTVWWRKNKATTPPPSGGCSVLLAPRKVCFKCFGFHFYFIFFAKLNILRTYMSLLVYTVCLPVSSGNVGRICLFYYSLYFKNDFFVFF